ncbi:MAG: hypothetical protein IPN94_02420 [Sphingobacteriales bacterium]|nr:hypothetical protein [Sphingobacteriales bacterium]
MHDHHTHLPGLGFTLAAAITSLVTSLMQWLPDTIQLLIAICSLALILLKIREQVLINQAKKKDLDNGRN